MKNLLLLLSLFAMFSCGSKKEEPHPELYEEGLEITEERTARHVREGFIKEYEALDGMEKDSVLYLTLSEYRDGTDFVDLAKQVYERAERKDIHFKACVILDGNKKVLGRYE